MDLSEREVGAEAPATAPKRAYRMTARREAVERTREQILAEAYRLWIERPYDDVTLDDVATAAGVARQTVHRQFGSKDDLFLAVVDWRRPREDEVTQGFEPGEVAAAIDAFVDRYEQTGDALVRFLSLEGRIDAVDHLLRQGRAGHLAELDHAFGPHLSGIGPEGRDRVLLALYAATDVMVWKLLRRDFGLSREDTEAIVHQLADGVLRVLAAGSEEETP